MSTPAVPLLLILLASATATYTPPKRAVSFWYAPSASDVNSTLQVLRQHNDTVTSVMLYCGQGVDNRGQLTGSISSLCTDVILPELKQLNIGAEFVVSDGSTNVTAHKLWFANASAVIEELMRVGEAHGIYGYNLDLEPQKVPGTAGDALVYAGFCAKLRSALNAKGRRLTIDVAQWSPMLSQFKELAAGVDMLMNMETYNANSMTGWIKGDAYGGYYDAYVINSGVPRPRAGVGLGSWPSAKCGNKTCWTTAAASVSPRLQRMADDGVPEAALFRLYGDQTGKTPGNERWPETFWWAPLKAYLGGGRG